MTRAARPLPLPPELARVVEALARVQEERDHRAANDTSHVAKRPRNHAKSWGIIYLTPRDIRGRYLLMERIRRTLTRR